MQREISRATEPAGNLPALENVGDKEEFVRQGFWPKLKRVLNKVPLASDALALYFAAFDAKTPKWARRIALGALVYFIVPLDLIPDYLIIPGYTDDASVLAMAIMSLRRYVSADHRKQAADWLKQ